MSTKFWIIFGIAVVVIVGVSLGWNELNKFGNMFTKNSPSLIHREPAQPGLYHFVVADQGPAFKTTFSINGTEIARKSSSNSEWSELTAVTLNSDATNTLTYVTEAKNEGEDDSDNTPFVLLGYAETGELRTRKIQIGIIGNIRQTAEQQTHTIVIPPLSQIKEGDYFVSDTIPEKRILVVTSGEATLNTENYGTAFNDATYVAYLHDGESDATAVMFALAANTSNADKAEGFITSPYIAMVEKGKGLVYDGIFPNKEDFGNVIFPGETSYTIERQTRVTEDLNSELIQKAKTASWDAMRQIESWASLMHTPDEFVRRAHEYAIKVDPIGGNATGPLVFSSTEDILKRNPDEFDIELYHRTLSDLYLVKLFDKKSELTQQYHFPDQELLLKKSADGFVPVMP